MKSKKFPEKAPFWMELFLIMWGLVFTICGIWLVLTTIHRIATLDIGYVSSSEYFSRLIAITLGGLLVWSGGGALISLYKNKK